MHYTIQLEDESSFGDCYCYSLRSQGKITREQFFKEVKNFFKKNNIKEKVDDEEISYFERSKEYCYCFSSLRFIQQENNDNEEEYGEEGDKEGDKEDDNDWVILF